MVLNMRTWIGTSFPALVLTCLLGGCAESTAVSSGHNTALNGANLIEMTDDMAMKISRSPAVRDTISRDGPLKIVVEPVENDMAPRSFRPARRRRLRRGCERF